MHPALESLSSAARDQLRRTRQATWMEPMLATLTHDEFSDPDWIFERKFDGQRCLMFRSGRRVSLLSRNRKRQNRVFPEIADAVSQLQESVILDAELVTFSGRLTSFSALQNRMHVTDPGRELLREFPVVAYIFDILYLDGYDLCRLELRDRKRVLRKALQFSKPMSHVAYRNEQGLQYLQQACGKGWEGLIAKRASSIYSHSRSRDWLKFKCQQGQEFVIGGYTEPQGSRKGFGALLVGYYCREELVYAGRVGTGFDDEFLQSFARRMRANRRKTCPFVKFDGDAERITWITPDLVAELEFSEWTGNGRLRHPRFLGLRDDKQPRDVVREDQHAV